MIDGQRLGDREDGRLLISAGCGDERCLCDLRFTANIDPPSGKPGGQADVLAGLSYRERELVVWNNHERALRIFVNRHLDRLCRRQRLRDKLRGFGRPSDDIDLLIVQLVHHGLYA